MKRIIIFGNSGSGKSTLAKKIAEGLRLGHLDLDILAWKDTVPPERLSIEKSHDKIKEFLSKNNEWVIEGCYSDLINLVTDIATEVVFLDLPIDECVENAKNRPWEPHKYKSKEDQDRNLSFLIDWIRDFENRSDVFSKKSQEKIYNDFQGRKSRLLSNEDSLVYFEEYLGKMK